MTKHPAKKRRLAIGCLLTLTGLVSAWHSLAGVEQPPSDNIDSIDIDSRADKPAQLLQQLTSGFLNPQKRPLLAPTRFHFNLASPLLDHRGEFGKLYGRDLGPTPRGSLLALSAGERPQNTIWIAPANAAILDPAGLLAVTDTHYLLDNTGVIAVPRPLDLGALVISARWVRSLSSSGFDFRRSVMQGKVFHDLDEFEQKLKDSQG
jgi:hypothetical protein